jgi:hypothetical protein
MTPYDTSILEFRTSEFGEVYVNVERIGEWAAINYDQSDAARNRKYYYRTMHGDGEGFRALHKLVLERIDKDISKLMHERQQIAALSPPKV